MKKMTFVFGILSAMLFSCQKEVKTNQPTPEKPSLSKIDFVVKKEGVTYGTYLGPGWPCMGAAKNCGQIDDVVIRPHQFEESTFEGLSAQQTGDLFMSEDYSNVINAMPDNMAAILQSGTVCLVFNFESDSIINYIVGSNLPVTPLNLDFAIQFNKQ